MVSPIVVPRFSYPQTMDLTPKRYKVRDMVNVINAKRENQFMKMSSPEVLRFRS